MILRDARVFVGGFDLSGDHNEVTYTIGVREIDGVRFGDKAEHVEAGIVTIEATGKGFARIAANGTNVALRGNLGVERVPMTIMSGDPNAEAAATESFLAEILTYRVGAAAGDLLSFEWSAKGQGEAPDGGNAIDTPKPITANGSSAPRAYTLGPGAKLTITLHVTQVSGAGATLNMVIESDSDTSFASPVVAATFAPVTAPGAWTVKINGPKSDTQWRARWTVAGTSPSFMAQLAIAAGLAAEHEHVPIDITEEADRDTA